MGDGPLVRARGPTPVRPGRPERQRRLAEIVEAADATPEQLAVREVNSSIYVFRAERLWPVLERLSPHNAQGELYLTDSIGLLVAEGGQVAVHKGGDAMEAEGVNTRAGARGGRPRRFATGSTTRTCSPA